MFPPYNLILLNDAPQSALCMFVILQDYILLTHCFTDLLTFISYKAFMGNRAHPPGLGKNISQYWFIKIVNNQFWNEQISSFIQPKVRPFAILLTHFFYSWLSTDLQFSVSNFLLLSTVDSFLLRYDFMKCCNLQAQGWGADYWVHR